MSTNDVPLGGPLLTAGERGLIEHGVLRGTVTVRNALGRAELDPRPNMLSIRTMQMLAEAAQLAAIRRHREETIDMKWANDFDRRYVQRWEARITPQPAYARSFGRARPRSPFAASPRERPFWRVTTALVVIACAVLVIGGTDLLRAAWQAWGGAR